MSNINKACIDEYIDLLDDVDFDSELSCLTDDELYQLINSKISTAYNDTRTNQQSFINDYSE